MRDYFEGLKRTDSIGDYVLEHKVETIKLAVVALCIMTSLMIFVYRGGDEVEIADTAKTIGEDQQTAYGSGNEEDENANWENEQESVGSALEGSGGSGASSGAANASGDIYVDIGGAVETPMLAKLPVGSRVEDAVKMAGGLSSDADISTINRAELLVDGQKIYIPKKGEAVTGGISAGSTVGSGSGAGIGSSGTGGSSGAGGSPGTASSKININTADLTTLQTITGVGPATAQKIIDYRTQIGRFDAIEDLKNVSGIGDKTFEKMKDQVVV